MWESSGLLSAPPLVILEALEWPQVLPSLDLTGAQCTCDPPPPQNSQNSDRLGVVPLKNRRAKAICPVDNRGLPGASRTQV